MKPIVILGSGLAGYTVARELRKLDQNKPLHIITADDGRFYSKPMLSNALGKGMRPEQLTSADSAKSAADLNTAIGTGTPVPAMYSPPQALTARGKATT